LVTNTFKNEVDASKLAETIAQELGEANKKFKERVEFGIGINSGDIINEIKGKKLIFTALGNSVLFAKKIAELSNGEVLISKEAYEKGISEIKADKKVIGGNEVYQIKKVVDYDKNKKFIDDFLKRTDKEFHGRYGSVGKSNFDPHGPYNPPGSHVPPGNNMNKIASENKASEDQTKSHYEFLA
jgi:hypothetical protein